MSEFVAQPQLVALADGFAGAAFDRAQWLPALQRLADLTGSQRAQLIGIGGPAAIPFNLVTDLPERALREFVEIEGGSPAVNPRVFASSVASVMEVVSEAHYATAIPHLATDVYLDFMHDHDIPFGCQASLIDEPHGLIGLALLRGRRDGESTPTQRALFAEAARHARGAVRVGMAMEANAVRYLGGVLESSGSAAFLCELDGRVRSMTGAAERLVARGRLQILAGRLTARHAGEAAALAAAMAAGAQSAPPQAVALAGQPGSALLVLDVMVAPAGGWGLFEQPKLLVMARRGLGETPEAHRLLQRVYGLTAAEAAVAVRVALGDSRDGIAGERGVSAGTIKSQMKAIFAKLGVSREREVAAMIAPLLAAGVDGHD